MAGSFQSTVLAPSYKRKIGKAMHDYAMFAPGDRVLLAVSGGIDSLALVAVLKIWAQKMPFELVADAVHIDHGFWKAMNVEASAIAVAGQLKKIGASLQVVDELEMPDGPRDCFLCSKNRRKQLFDYAETYGYNKLALGHHKDDLIETFFLNVLYGGNISTMVPRQDLFGGSLSIIRPLAYLEKSEVREIANSFGLCEVKNLCPVMGDSRRERVRQVMEKLGADDPTMKASIFAALSNVRQEYLLK